ncbi:MAG: hypothetical protein HY425_00190 [Candidatus Levybacteria bacterium]|nr:hypothetical protein [Candidatus Levybacteria bacterium]
MQERLCEQCQLTPEKGCFLKEVVADIARNVPPKEKQTPVSKGSDITVEAQRAYDEIGYFRTEARERLNCPNVNSPDTNPSYPGRNNL